MLEKLDLSSLEKALASLERAVLRSKEFPEDEELRDAVIQRFEYSYELSWKMIKREIERTSPSKSELDGLSFRDLFRMAAEKGIVENPEHWFDYREKRNITSHTYDSSKAEVVYQSAIGFLDDAEKLFAELKKRNT